MERAYSVKADEVPSAATVAENCGINAEEPGYLGLAKAQFHDTYIISQNEDSIIIIDQHAAHERIVMEKLKRSLMNEQRIATQMMLIPEVVELPLSDKTRIIEAAEELKKLGLVIEEFGPSAVIVQEIPALLGDCNVKNWLKIWLRKWPNGVKNILLAKNFIWFAQQLPVTVQSGPAVV